MFITNKETRTFLILHSNSFGGVFSPQPECYMEILWPAIQRDFEGFEDAAVVDKETVLLGE
jgi:hypothetical protein